MLKKSHPQQAESIPALPDISDSMGSDPINLTINLKEHLEGIERSLIEQALDAEKGVVARAAERLQIRRTTLVEKMRKYGISR